LPIVSSFRNPLSLLKATKKVFGFSVGML
jgi:hypothetical protein